MLYTCSQCGAVVEDDEKPFGWLTVLDEDYYNMPDPAYICDECNVKKFRPMFVPEGMEMPEAMPDVVNHPPHYTHGDVECIDAIRASMTYDEFAGYLKGNSMKYLWRYRDKGNEVQDLEKCLWYVEKLKQVTEERSS